MDKLLFKTLKMYRGEDSFKPVQQKESHIPKVKYHRFQIDDVWLTIKYAEGECRSVRNSKWLKCKSRTESVIRFPTGQNLQIHILKKHFKDL